jgi:hypothetical protein
MWQSIIIFTEKTFLGPVGTNRKIRRFIGYIPHVGRNCILVGGTYLSVAPQKGIFMPSRFVPRELRVSMNT